jgi:hypothetical protein
MKHVIEAGTDGATLCAFDATALPNDLDSRIAEDPIGLMERLRDRGVLWFGGTGGDGRHIVHVLVDEEPASGTLDPPAWDGHLEVPSGGLWVCGAEYIANDPARGSDFTPPGGLSRFSMGKQVKIAPGRYVLQAFEVDGDTPSVRVTGWQWLQLLPLVLMGLGGLTAGLSGLAFVVVLLIKLGQLVVASPIAQVGWHALLPLFLLFCAGAAAVILGRTLGARIARLPKVERDQAAYDDERATNPDVVLVLRRVGDAAF